MMKYVLLCFPSKPIKKLSKFDELTNFSLSFSQNTGFLGKDTVLLKLCSNASGET